MTRVDVIGLHIYPVKSCSGVAVDAVEVVTTGFSHDRRWMVVDADDRYLTQREHPVLSRVAVEISDPISSSPVADLTPKTPGDGCASAVSGFASPSRAPAV